MFATIGPDSTKRSRKQRGQGLVEFALVIPFIFILLMGLLEMALALNASLAVTRASQHGAHLAATAGNIAGADCLVLVELDGDLGTPNHPGRVSEVVIERTALAGNASYAKQRWLRSGQTDCALPDGSPVTIPYSLVENGYPEAQRCTVLKGCPSLTPARSTVDNIGVTVKYTHQWVTPLNGALGLVSGGGGNRNGWAFEQRNIFRVEPTL